MSETAEAESPAWTGVVATFGLLLRKRKKHEKITNKKNRFAVIVCARNEEKVLPYLLDSLARQEYPKDFWHVYVIADHCTDHTADVVRHYPLATVWERNEGPRTGKGDVLNWGLRRLREERAMAYDAILVFDADNVAAPNFMEEMSNSLNEGSDVVQANRLAGKPFRSTVTKWYAIYWTAYSFLYSYPRYSLGLSPFLTGTGFAVRTSLLQKYGWKTTSMRRRYAAGSS